jgi:hypothetical protein
MLKSNEYIQSATLLLPLPFEYSAYVQSATLLFPLPFEYSADFQTAVFWLPMMFKFSAWSQMARFDTIFPDPKPIETQFIVHVFEDINFTTLSLTA